MNSLLIITGASRGIGRATAETFSAAGFSVINVSRSGCDVKGVENIILDLGEHDWPQALTEKLTSAAQNADSVSLIHNAAVLFKDNSENLSAEQLRKAMEINVIAPQRLNQLLLPVMKRGSSVLYVGSTLAEKAVPNACSYVTSKHAGIGLMRANCQDLAGRGIHTSSICPGFTDTEMLRDHVGNSEEVFTAIKAEVTQGRLIEPKEIAETLLFCARQPVLNGAVIAANLGQVEH